jgi:putative ABC transport system permease protein
MFLPKLVITQFLSRKVRTALTVAAITFSVSLVVAVTTGFTTMEGVATRFLSANMGQTDAQITRPNDPRGGVNPDVVDAIAADPDVETVIGRLETETRLVTEKDEIIQGPEAQVIGVRRPEDKELDKLPMTEGRWFETSDAQEVVIDQVIAEKLKLKIGGTLTLPALKRKLPLKVVGQVRKPGPLAEHIPTMYVPLETLQKFVSPDNPRNLSRVSIVLKEGADAQQFAARWKANLEKTDPTLRLRLTSEQRQTMLDNLQGVRLLNYLGGMVSMLSATFIIFTTLSMGVSERQRTLAMMRAVGMLRAQVARLVVLEAVLLSFAAVIIGVPLGLLFVRLLVGMEKFAELFQNAGVVVDVSGIALAAGGSIAAALAASLLPAWQATRVDPLAAMTPLATPSGNSVPTGATVAGLALIGVDPFIMFGPITAICGALGLDDPANAANTFRFYAHFALGLPTLMLGFFLLAPLFVWTIERVLGPLVAAMFGLQYSLLRQQLSGGLWRAAGTCASLMVGLAVLTVLQVQGHSALSAWQLPTRFPDVFIFSPNALGPDDQRQLFETPGLRKGQVMPIAMASPQLAFLGNSLPAIATAIKLVPDATMFFGVDPDIMFTMMGLDFRHNDGRSMNRDEQQWMERYATEKLKLGRHVLVTDEFRQLRGLRVGDVIPLRTGRHGVVDYTICGIVWSPGIDVMAGRFDLGRQMEQRTAASVFGSLADAREDFGVDAAYLFAANVEYFTEREVVMKALRRKLARENITVSDVRQLKATIQNGLRTLLLLVSTVAFAAMAVASLGVTNTIMASVRSRRWQFGVLRSIGVTRTQLLRLVLAEAFLLGLVGVGLGLAAGMEMAINARRLSQIMVGFTAEMDIPWAMLAVGSGIVMTISIAASLWPAISTARSQPLELLSAGRASA